MEIEKELEDLTMASYYAGFAVAKGYDPIVAQDRKKQADEIRGNITEKFKKLQEKLREFEIWKFGYDQSIKDALRSDRTEKK